MTDGDQIKRNQSSKEPLTITGTGFKGEPVLNFEPAIWAGTNYTVTVVSETELKLDLVEGSMWSKTAGALIAKGINVGDGDVRIEEIRHWLLRFLCIGSDRIDRSIDR